MPKLPFSLYVHIPFCFHKCPYCDFNTYAVSRAPENEYIDALLAELDYRAAMAEWKGRAVQTVFFGGGTPSLFHPASIARFLNAARERFNFSPGVEISLEANPGTVSYESLVGYRQSGVNRISFGGQTFSTPLLKRLGRIHTPDQIESAIANAIQAQILNLNLDLMFGIPDQTTYDLEKDLKRAFELGLAHLSLYGLTIEKGTPYYSAQKRGDLHLPPDETVLAMMDKIDQLVPAQGFARYEISNFAKPGFEARHNLAYWDGDDYLGLGAGAHSFCSRINFGRRWANYALPSKYMETATSAGNTEAWHEELDLKGKIFEFFFLGLRKTAGVSPREFTERFGLKVEEIYPNFLDVLCDEGMLTFDSNKIALTPKGLRIADTLIENFAEPLIPSTYSVSQHSVNA